MKTTIFNFFFFGNQLQLTIQLVLHCTLQPTVWKEIAVLSFKINKQ